MAKLALRKIEKCIFCGGEPTTKEHVWPRWSHRYLPKVKKKWHALHAVEHLDRTDIEIVKHAGDPLDWQVKCVDEKCNNGWMRQLEDAARPIMLPLMNGTQSPIFLGRRQKETLAAWIALKTIIQEYAPRASKIAHRSQLKRLWQKKLAPDRTWKIWIASYDGRAANTLWTAHPMLIVPDSVAARRKSRRATYFNSEAATYVIGQLFIHLVRSPHEGLVRKFRFHPDVAVKLLTIWPLSGFDAKWPPESLTDIEAGYVAWAIRSLVKGSK